MSDPPTDLLADEITVSDLDTNNLVALIEASHGDMDTFLVSQDVQDTLGEITTTSVRKRPKTLTGTTQRIDTGYDHIYVNINTDADGRPVELFTTYGQSGGFTKSMTEAIHNLATLALRSNADPEDLVNQLRGIRSPRVGYDHGTRVDSIPDEIGLALERVVNDELPDTTLPGGRQSSLTQHDDVDDDVNDLATVANDGHETSPEDEQPEAASSVSDSNDDLGPSLDTPEEVSVSGTPDPQIEPTGVPNAEPGTDPHLNNEPDLDTQAPPSQSSDTEPCPECGSIDIFYSEGCMTCQNCGYSECG
jgi:ribonucleoside-diphosphate reductase alpha chain